MTSELRSLERALDRHEREGERIAALFRIAISVTMIAVVWVSATSDRTQHPLLMVAAIYGVVSLVGLGLAWARVHHRLLPFVFVFVDCLVVIAALGMSARMQGMGMTSATTLPLFSLAFVVLAHAALRYRPWLVAFGAVTFIGLFAVLSAFPGWFLTSSMSRMPASNRMEMMQDAGAGSWMVPLVFLGFAAVLLFYIVRRTRNLAVLTARDGRRASQLARFFSPAIASRLATEELSTETYGGRQPVAVLFIDVRGFTSLAESMDPEQLTEFLVSFRREVCRIIFEHDGTIDKFIGDAVLAVFGTPHVRNDDAERAVRAAVAIARGIDDWFLTRRKARQPAARVGIGAHYGEVFAGVIESGQILEHTVIGDTVNVAQRVERATRKLNARVALSEQLVVSAGLDIQSVGLTSKTEVTLAGHEQPIVVYHDVLKPQTA